MGKLKRFAVGSLVTLIALGGATGLWYQRHYVLPPEPLYTKEILPSPNGFDTLRDAAALRVEQLDGVAFRASLWKPSAPLEKRLALLAANQESIAQTRLGLTQSYLQPPVSWPQNHYSTYQQLHQQALLLVFAAKTHADSGNYPEAMTCALDAIELGARLPRGGPLQSVYLGSACEAVGKRMAWELADKIEEDTAHAAVERLQRIQSERWPLADALQVERRVNYQTVRAMFAGGPIPGWKSVDNLLASYEQPPLQTAGSWRTDAPQKSAWQKKWERLWLQARIVYYGPRTVLESTDGWLQELKEDSQAPWNPGTHRRRPTDHPLSQLAEPFWVNEDLRQMDAQNQLPFLEAYLWLRVEFLATGHYPPSAAMPRDPFSPTGALLGYKTDGQSFTLWSVGPDGKDDHGAVKGGDPLSLPYPEGDLIPKVNSW